MIGHSPDEHGAALPETARERRAALVPFARAEGPIVRLPKDFRERAHGIQVVVHAEQGAPAHHHGSAGRADGPMVGAHVVGSPERVSILHETVQVRRADIAVAVRADGVGLQIVSQKEQDIRGGIVRIGLGIHRTGRREGGEECENAKAQEETMHGAMRSGLEGEAMRVREGDMSKYHFRENFWTKTGLASVFTVISS